MSYVSTRRTAQPQYVASRPADRLVSSARRYLIKGVFTRDFPRAMALIA
jgi:hypothetical protein